MATPTPAPIYLFISKDCENCRNLIQEIRKKPEVAKKIQAVPIETTPRLPPNLTHVPTIMEKGKMMVGKDCFEWVAKQGELEAAPLMSAKGSFENTNYSFIGSDESGSTLNGGGMGDNYSFIGQKNGSEGIEAAGSATGKQEAQQQQQQQQQQMQLPPQLQSQQVQPQKKGITMDFEKLQEMRNSEAARQRPPQAMF
jgi:hypothetical protein